MPKLKTPKMLIASIGLHLGRRELVRRALAGQSTQPTTSISMGGAKAPKGKGKSPGASPNKAKSKAKKHATPLAEPDAERSGGRKRRSVRSRSRLSHSRSCVVNALCRPNIKFLFSNNRKTRASYRVTGTEPQQRTRTHWTVSNVE